MYEISNPDDERYHDDQLRPVKGGRYVDIFGPPQGMTEEEVGRLHTHIEREQGAVVVHSGWQPNEEQLLQLRAGAHVRVALWTYPIPPMAVSIEPPVDGEGVAMIWAPAFTHWITRSTAEEYMERVGEDYANEAEANEWLAGEIARLHAEAVAAEAEGLTAEEQVRRDFKPDTGQDG